MFDFLENIDAEMNDGGARVVPIITEIHEVNDGTDIQDNKAEDIIHLMNLGSRAGTVSDPYRWDGKNPCA